MKDKIVELLKSNKANFELREYPLELKSAFEVSKYINFPYRQMFKSLLCVYKNKYYLMLLPSEKNINFKKIGFPLKFAPKYMVEKTTGYKLGSVSPFLLRTNIQIIVDLSINDYTQISVGCGEYGYELIVAVNDFLSILKPQIQEISIH